ncbi:hypothetical protein MLD38_039286 [Melastoma candidum]|nr:hypothetical protein MLD38_039286 [Melastoma candidum]
MLAGVNPVIISRLQEFHPKTKLDPAIYGNQASSLTEDHIKNRLDGMSVHEALEKKQVIYIRSSRLSNAVFKMDKRHEYKNVRNTDPLLPKGQNSETTGNRAKLGASHLYAPLTSSGRSWKRSNVRFCR